MISNLRTNYHSVVILAALFLSINPITVSASEEIFDLLKTIALDCAKEHGYEDWNPGGFEEHELRPGEKAWRQCVYSGIRKDLMPNSGFPDDWENMIIKDIQYTQAIEKGEMTRFERWVNNRQSRQLTLANEALVIDEESQKRHREVLDEHLRRQVELLLRLPPPLPRIP